MSHAMNRDKLSDKEQVINIMQAILDGLQYGNWPMSHNETKKTS